MLNRQTFRGGLGETPAPDITGTITNIQGTLDSLDTPACMPTGSMGPLSPGQVWCDTQTGVPPAVPGTTNALAANMTGINIGGITVSPWTIMFGVMVGMLVLGSHAGRSR